MLDQDYIIHITKNVKFTRKINILWNMKINPIQIIQLSDRYQYGAIDFNDELKAPKPSKLDEEPDASDLRSQRTTKVSFPKRQLNTNMKIAPQPTKKRYRVVNNKTGLRL